MLGVLLQNLWTVFNPRTIVVGGKSCVGSPRLLQFALETLDGYAQLAGMPAPSVRPARHGLLATAVGRRRAGAAPGPAADAASCSGCAHSR